MIALFCFLNTTFSRILKIYFYVSKSLLELGGIIISMFFKDVQLNIQIIIFQLSEILQDENIPLISFFLFLFLYCLIILLVLFIARQTDRQTKG